MSKKGTASSYIVAFLKDLLFIGPFFLVSLYLVWDSVPSNTPFWIAFWAIVGAGMMSCIAWIALQMFKVVLADQTARRKSAEARR